MPTLIVWAAGDVFFDVKWAHYLSRLIPGAGEPVVVQDAGLYFADERPETLVPHLRRHWEAVAESGPKWTWRLR